LSTARKWSLVFMIESAQLHPPIQQRDRQSAPRYLHTLLISAAKSLFFKAVSHR
jgi:hypothetical protein